MLDWRIGAGVVKFNLKKNKILFFLLLLRGGRFG
jgi:hypothetical protein